MSDTTNGYVIGSQIQHAVVSIAIQPKTITSIAELKEYGAYLSEQFNGTILNATIPISTLEGFPKGLTIQIHPNADLLQLSITAGASKVVIQDIQTTGAGNFLEIFARIEDFLSAWAKLMTFEVTGGTGTPDSLNTNSVTEQRSRELIEDNKDQIEKRMEADKNKAAGKDDVK